MKEITKITEMDRRFMNKQANILFFFGNSKRRVIELLQSHSRFSSVFIILCANVFSSFITFVVNIFLAQKFGPENFGILSLAVSIMMMVSIIFDVGLNLTLVRFFNLYQKEEKRQKLLLLALLIFKIVIVALLIGISLPAGSLLTKLLNFDSVHQPLLTLAVITGGVFTLWVYFQNYQQAHRNFRKLSLHIIGYGLLRISFIVLLLALYVQTFKITPVFIYFYSIPVVLIVLIGILPILQDFFSVKNYDLGTILRVLKDALRYSKWVAISSVFYSLILRTTQLILALRSSKYELGILSAGFVFTIAFSTLNMAVRAVFFPHVTSFNKIADMKFYYEKVRKFIPYYGIMAIILIIMLAIIQVVFLGSKYLNALPVFLITAVALSATIFLGLWSMMVHTLMHPEIHAIVNVLRFISTCIIAYFLSAGMGAMGGAIAYALPLILGELFMVYFVRKTLNEESKN